MQINEKWNIHLKSPYPSILLGVFSLVAHHLIKIKPGVHRSHGNCRGIPFTGWNNWCEKFPYFWLSLNSGDINWTLFVCVCGGGGGEHGMLAVWWHVWSGHASPYACWHGFPCSPPANLAHASMCGLRFSRALLSLSLPPFHQPLHTHAHARTHAHAHTHFLVNMSVESE